MANSKIAYEAFEQFFSGPRWERLKSKGAQIQRPLWASTSTKNPAYPDVLYVEELIGPHTVNTMPPQTIDAYRDHGNPANRVKAGLAEAHKAVKDLESFGIGLPEVTQALEDAGVKSFSDSFEKLIARIRQKEIQIGVRANP